MDSISADHYKGIEERITSIRDQLQTVQERMGNQLPDVDSMEKGKYLKKQLEKLGRIEESIYRQKS